MATDKKQTERAKAYTKTLRQRVSYRKLARQVVQMVDSGLSYEEISLATGYAAISIKEAYERKVNSTHGKRFGKNKRII